MIDIQKITRISELCRMAEAAFQAGDNVKPDLLQSQAFQIRESIATASTPPADIEEMAVRILAIPCIYEDSQQNEGLLDWFCQLLQPGFDTAAFLISLGIVPDPVTGSCVCTYRPENIDPDVWRWFAERNSSEARAA